MKKGLIILIFGLAMILVTNLLRLITGDLNTFQFNSEGLNYAIVIFALGAGFIGWFSTNDDRPILTWFVFGIGVLCCVFVFFSYDKNVVVLISYFILVIISSLMIRVMEVKYP